MAAPNPFQKLKHGVLLCKANFMTFVETFNFLVDFAQNIRGDGENGRGDGIISVDRRIPDQPVIRSRINTSTIDYLLENKRDKGRFCIKETVSGPSSETVTIGNCFYRIGGSTYTMDDTTVSVAAGQIVALKVNITGLIPQPSLTTYSSFSELSAEEGVQRYYICPLYMFKEDGGIECDFRVGPDAAAWEFAQ